MIRRLLCYLGFHGSTYNVVYKWMADEYGRMNTAGAVVCPHCNHHDFF